MPQKLVSIQHFYFQTAIVSQRLLCSPKGHRPHTYFEFKLCNIQKDQMCCEVPNSGGTKFEN